MSDNFFHLHYRWEGLWRAENFIAKVLDGEMVHLNRIRTSNLFDLKKSFLSLKWQ